MSEARELDLLQAQEVLEEYTQPNTMIDNGNLFFAACEFRSAYEALREKNAELRAELESTKKHYQQLWDEK